MRARSGRRLLAMLAVVMAGLGAVAGRLVWMQGMASERFVALAADQRERRVALPAERGDILDRDGAVLALSMRMESIFANPRFVPDPQAAAAALAPVLGIDAAALAGKLGQERGFVYLARKVDPVVAAKAKALGIPGVESVAEPKRFYPAGSLGAHVLGFVGTDNKGLAGLEAQYDGLLSGRPGEMLIERDPEGRSIPQGKSHLTPPAPGDDIILTIDREVQFAAESALARAVESYRAKGGSVVVLRPQTGEVLALANLPAFDPNHFATAVPDARRNRAVVDVYEPGSANKVITAAAAIESGTADPSAVISVPDRLALAGRTFRDSHPHPTLDLTLAQVIEQSSNVGTIKVAVDVGKDRLHDYLLRFGYGSPTGLDFPGEAGGIVPNPERWWSTSLPTIAIGQGVAVTPMQIVGVYGVVANGGEWIQPRLVKARVDGSGRHHPARAPGTRRVIEPGTARQLTGMLTSVVEGTHGTGKAAAVPGYRVAGKTGTAQKPRRDIRGYEGYVASFVGFAPADRPQLVVGVMLDDPDPIWGGVTAAPVFREVMQFSLRHLGIGPGPVPPPAREEGTPLPAPARSRGAAPDPKANAPVSTDTAD